MYTKSVNSKGPPALASSGPSSWANPIQLQFENAALPSLHFDPTQQADLLQSLGQGGVTIVAGDPSKADPLELFYYRVNGSTSFDPGVNRISLELQLQNPPSTATNDPAPSPLLPVSPEGDLQAPHAAPESTQAMFDETGMPMPHIYGPLVDVFFKVAGQYFPSIWQSRMKERLATSTMSAFLMNCMCAIAARFAPVANPSPTAACAPFVSKAQELLVPLLHLPTHDVSTGLLLLAWASFGQGSESGLWQYSGMAFRMAIDLGIHEITEVYESALHVVRTRLLFWVRELHGDFVQHVLRLCSPQTMYITVSIAHR